METKMTRMLSAILSPGKYDGRIGICDYCLPVLGLVALGSRDQHRRHHR